MGDVQTHHAIYKMVRDSLSEVRSSEDYPYVRFGNYLTDLSQVRDTLAYAMGRLKVWHRLRVGVPEKGKAGRWKITLSAGDVPAYLDDLFGHPANLETSSALAQYLEHLVRFFTLGIFTHSVVADSDVLPEAEALRVFKRNFTRYYPHEHLDFPPWPWTDPLGDTQVDTGSRLLQSLVQQMAYIVQSLSAVEYAWIQALNQPQASPPRHDVLADLGHTIHAVEDFFFHTNVLELELVARSFRNFQSDLAKPQPFFADRDRTKQFFGAWFKTHGLDELPQDEHDDQGSVRALRRYYRRLQGPSADSDHPDQLSTITSHSALEHVSTGGFGEKDIFHTIYGALVNLQNDPGVRALLTDRRMQIVLLRDLLLPEEREKLKEDKYLDGEIARHKQQLADPRTDAQIDKWRQDYGLRDSEIAEFKAALELDRRLTTKYPRAIGIGGFLLNMAAQVQEEHETSEAKSQEFDGQQLVIDGRTQNGASGETIGSHSLLSKDTEHSWPFRARAVSYASFVSSYFARTMAIRLGAPGGRLDWQPVVAHFLRYPRLDAGVWEAQLRQAADGPDGQLNHDALQDKPDLKPASPKIAALRIQPNAKRALQKLYDDEAVKADAEWRDNRE